MGRRKKYFSDLEKKEANNKKVKEFYWNNKDKLDSNAKAYYWKKKIKNLLEIGNTDGATKMLERAISKGIDRDKLQIEN